MTETTKLGHGAIVKTVGNNSFILLGEFGIPAGPHDTGCKAEIAIMEVMTEFESTFPHFEILEWHVQYGMQYQGIWVRHHPVQDPEHKC